MDCDLEKCLRSICKKRVIPIPDEVTNADLRVMVEYFLHEKLEVYLDAIPANQVRLREDKVKLLDLIDDVSALLKTHRIIRFTLSPFPSTHAQIPNSNNTHSLTHSHTHTHTREKTRCCTTPRALGTPSPRSC